MSGKIKDKVGLVIGILILIVIGAAIYFTPVKKPGTSTPTPTPSTPTPTPNLTGIYYKNDKYGFAISLPDSWKGYTIIDDEWDGDTIDAQGQVHTGTIHGPLISVRHPDWDYKAPRQDIPIMVFTIKQWNDMQADKFHIGAAPINPSELGRNKNYVFAVPARYNYAYLTGYEEVDQILKGDNFVAF